MKKDTLRNEEELRKARTTKKLRLNNRKGTDEFFFRVQ